MHTQPSHKSLNIILKEMIPNSPRPITCLQSFPPSKPPKKTLENKKNYNTKKNIAKTTKKIKKKKLPPPLHPPSSPGTWSPRSSRASASAPASPQRRRRRWAAERPTSRCHGRSGKACNPAERSGAVFWMVFGDFLRVSSEVFCWFFWCFLVVF